MTTPPLPSDDDADRTYHLTTRREWDAAQTSGQYDRSTRGKSLTDVGFIHCSTPSQLSQVAELFYRDCDEDLVVLVMHVATLEESGRMVRYEDGGNGQLYPHIYAPVPVGLVDEVLPASVDDGGRFTFTD